MLILIPFSRGSSKPPCIQSAKSKLTVSSVLMPKDSVTTFEGSEHIESVEVDKEVKTQ